MNETSSSLTESPLLQMGRGLARARILKSLTQVDIANACGISRASVQAIEGGRNVGVSAWLAVATRLGYLDDLLSVMQQEKPSTIEQFQAIAQGHQAKRKRVRK